MTSHPAALNFLVSQVEQEERQPAVSPLENIVPSNLRINVTIIFAVNELIQEG